MLGAGIFRNRCLLEGHTASHAKPILRGLARLTIHQTELRHVRKK